MIVIDPGHGGVDGGALGGRGIVEKAIVYDYARELKSRLEATKKFKVVMTRNGDEFVSLGDRVRIARAANAALFISIHADAVSEADARSGTTVYTCSDRASDAEAGRIAERENAADKAGGADTREEDAGVADILFDLSGAKRAAYAHIFSRGLVAQWQGAVRTAARIPAARDLQRRRPVSSPLALRAGRHEPAPMLPLLSSFRGGGDVSRFGKLLRANLFVVAAIVSVPALLIVFCARRAMGYFRPHVSGWRANPGGTQRFGDRRVAQYGGRAGGFDHLGLGPVSFRCDVVLDYLRHGFRAHPQAWRAGPRHLEYLAGFTCTSAALLAYVRPTKIRVGPPACVERFSLTPTHLPAISIGVPVSRNWGATVAHAIASVLAQSFYRLGIDRDRRRVDRRHRAGRPPVERSRIRLSVRVEHRGLPFRLNKAVGLSAGEYFARMDGDDVMYPERLGLQHSSCGSIRKPIW